MGIRFACHHCGKRLNVKSELAGKRGVCPACQSRFRIPMSEADVLREHESEAIWYVRPPSGGQYGPASTDLLRQWIQEGRVASSALLWRDGWPHWRDASDVLADQAGSLPGEANPGGMPFATTATGATGASGAGSINAGPSKTGPSRAGATGMLEALPHVGSAASPYSSATSPRLSGQSDVGFRRRIRSHRRVLWIGLLLVLALGLVGVLVVVANRET